MNTPTNPDLLADSTPKPGRLKRAFSYTYKKLTRPISLATMATIGLHAYIFNDAVKHIAKKTAMEAILVITNQPTNSKKIIRNDFELTEEIDKRRKTALLRNKPEYEKFITKVKPVLDGSLESANRLHGDFAVSNLVADIDRLTLGVSDQVIELGKTNLQQAFKDLDEEKGHAKISRDLLHYTLDRLAPGEAYELVRSSSYESMALNFQAFTQNCDARNYILFMGLLHLDPEALKHTYIQQFVDHLRVIYEMDGNKYILERGINRFPDEVSLKNRSALIPAAGYLAMRFTGKSISELQGVQYFGSKTVLQDDVKLAITDLNLSYYKAMDLAKLATDFSGLGYFSTTKENQSNTIGYRKKEFTSSKENAKVYPDEVGETIDKSTTSDTSKNANPTTLEIPQAINAPQPINTPSTPSPERLTEGKIDEVLEVRKAEQQKIEQTLVEIENGNNVATENEAFMEIDIIYPQTLTVAELEKNFPQPTLKDFQELIDSLSSSQLTSFKQTFFDQKGNFTNGNHNRNIKVDFTPEQGEKFQQILAKFNAHKVNEYSLFETPALVALIERGYANVTSIDGDSDELYIDLSSVEQLSLENLQALIKDKNKYSIKLSSIDQAGFNLILGQKKPFNIIVNNNNLSSFLNQSQPANCQSLSFNFRNNLLNTDTANKLASLNTKIFLHDVIVKKTSAEALSQSKKPVINRTAQYFTAKLLEDYLNDLQTQSAWSKESQVNINTSSIDEETAAVLAKLPTNPLYFNSLTLLRPEVAQLLNNKERSTLIYNGLKVLTPKTVLALKGLPNLTVPASVITPENLAAFNENGQATGTYTKLVLSGELLNEQMLRNYRFLRDCLRPSTPQLAKKCQIQKKLLDKTREQMQVIKALGEYKGDIFIDSGYALPYAIVHTLFSREAETTYITANFSTETSDEQFEQEKTRILEELKHHTKVKIAFEANILNERKLFGKK